VVEFKPYDHGRAWSDILLPLYFTDGGLDIKNTLAASGEPMFSSAKRLLDDPINKMRDIHDIWRVSTIQSQSSGHKAYVFSSTLPVMSIGLNTWLIGMPRPA
jgi:hypothetical protein